MGFDLQEEELEERQPVDREQARQVGLESLAHDGQNLVRGERPSDIQNIRRRIPLF